MKALKEANFLFLLDLCKFCQILSIFDKHNPHLESENDSVNGR